MRKYRFRLEPVLRYREILEDLAHKRLADAQRDHRQAVDALAALCGRKDALLVEMAESQQGKVSPTLVKQNMNYLAFLRSSIEKQALEVARLAAIVEEKRLALIETTKDKKAIERMRQHDFERYMLEVRAVEQKFIDEVATVRHTRALREEQL